MGASEDLSNINKEINSIRKELGRKPLQPFKLEDLEKAKESLAGLSAELREMSSDLDYISKSFKDSVNELSKQNTYLSDAKSSLRGISSISEKILQYRKGETSLSEKELQNLQKQAKAKFTSLQNSIKSGQLNEKNTKEAQNALDNQELFNRELDRTIELNKQVNKEIGLLGTGIGGVSKVLSKMGFGDMSQSLQDAIDKTKNARLQQKLNNDELKKLKKEYAGLGVHDLEKKKALREQMSSLSSQNKELGSQTSKYKNIGNALKDQLTSYNAIDAIIMGLIDGFNQSQKGIGDMAKGLGMSATRAADMRHEFANISNLSMNANLTVKDLQESQIAVGQALGSNAMLNKADLETMTDMVKKTGLQHSELIGIEKLSLATGTSLEDNVENALGGATAFAKQNKMVIDNNKVLREVNKASSSLKLSLGGSVKELGKAVVQAQKFGLNLEQAEKMSSSLLDFEQSIENELSAELLTGKNLNLERARGLALNGDVAGAAAEIASQVGSAADFGKMNVIQQEAIAKAIGLGRDELAASLIEKESLAALNAEEGETALQAYENLKKQGLTQDEIIAKVGEEAALQLEQQSAQDKFNTSVGKLKEIFTQVMDALAPVFDTLASIVSTVLPAINFLLSPLIEGFSLIGQGVSMFVKGLKEGKGPAIALAAVLGVMAIPLIQSAVGAIFTAFSMIPFGLGIPLAAIAVAGLFSLLSKSKSEATVNDGVFPAAGGSGYGKRVLTGPEGSIQLNNKDTVIAGTNLFGNDVKSEPGKSPQMGNQGEIKIKSGGSDMSAVIAAINNLASRPINVKTSVQLDGKELATMQGKYPNEAGDANGQVAYKIA
jgi:uncharacterized membrane protein